MAKEFDISHNDMLRALRIYWRHAWPRGKGTALPDFEGLTRAQLLGRFQNETGCTAHACHRYVLQLGNHIYPYMKFAVEQCVYGGHFYFLADCHDDSIVPPGSEAESWHDLRARNFKIKLAIESEWEMAKLPTFRTASRKATGSFKKPGRRSRQILIVDDEPANAALTGAMLRADGFGTRTASSGSDALRMVDDRRPDLIVSDFEMPGLTGREFAERLKADEDTREIPVLICTYADVRESDLKPADALLRRPFSREDLSAAISRLLTRGQN